ncbi:CubicO group peptidase (beta-lactamase class C family) [Sphingomonas naasensis]|uniref:Beta-lactamase n=1 Tax=Sphingomonas naasensis TaxID=1344951 RepID=A0A4S1W8U9_9SPHN|nr:serine hydrolase domain-containing protein [Sphingomonas naasensis]NIJ19462.1 CubicO group peptidase (beta-lactamase class C family) [Sphingomonas naasensis]TGX39199.1 class A beta-lactamase-related serine hydrolase [Sphingomonas naasensis]
MLTRAGMAMLLLATPAAAQRASVDSVARAAGADYLAAEQGVGLSIGIVRNGKVSTWHFGSIAKGGPAPGDAAAYEIGSIAKTITSLLLARAVVAGKASLDDDVRKYLDGDWPNLAFEGEPMRLLHLANMTSALPDNLPDLSAIKDDPGRFRMARAIAAYDKGDFLADLHKVSLARRPGAEVAHSNVGAQLLIYVVERIYGAPYETLLAREIEKPLGFAAGAAVTGYDAGGVAAATLPREKFGWRYSLADMLRYAALQLDEKDPAVALSHKGTWFTLDKKTWVALNWIVTALPGGGRQLRTSGGTFGFSSVIQLYPERGLGIVLLANRSTPTAQGKLSEIADRIASE